MSDAPGPARPAAPGGLALPPRMRGRPFGVDADGRRLDRTKGVIVKSTVETMLDCVAEAAAASVPGAASPAERAARVQAARGEALAELVSRLNGCIGDPRYHVTGPSLLDEGNSYSVELDLYLSELCRLLSGAPDFHRRRGTRAIPASIAILARPFSMKRVFELIPRFATRFADSDMRALESGSSSAVIAWSGQKDVASIPEPLRPAFIEIACPWLAGLLESVPQKLAGLPPAQVRERRCQRSGDPYCEYEVRWERPRPRLGAEFWLPAAAALGLVLVARHSPSVSEYALPAALACAVGGTALARMKVLAFERDAQKTLLLETRQKAEEQADALQQANALLQAANVEQRERLGELTTLHDLGLALRETLDVDELLDVSLRVVATHLGFERALLLLADEERRELRGGRSWGIPAELTAAVGAIRLPLDAPDPILAPLLASGRPARLRAHDPHAGRILRKVLEAVGCQEFLAAPLVAKGRVVGLLLVDNASSGRAIPDGVEPLFQTAAALVANALDAALLRGTLERRVAERTRQLEEAKRALERSHDLLLESERRQADIIEMLPDPTFVVDREGTVIAWNRALEEITGVPKERVLGRSGHEHGLVLHGERRPILVDLVLEGHPEVEARYEKLTRRGDVLAAEAFVPALRRGAGGWVAAMAGALRDRKGELTGAIESFRDVTEERSAAEALEKARDAAEQASRAKSAFLATMSHEIRTPMNGVLGMTSLLLDTPLTPEQRSFVSTIRSSGDALLTIINDILDFSKVEAGRLELEPHPFEVGPLVDSVLGLLAARAAEKGLRLHARIAPEVPRAVAADPTRLKQVLLNLAGNAVKFTERGEVEVSVAVEEGAGEAPPRLLFSVRDTGIGIPAGRMDRLFRSFSQVDSSTARRFGGTGLGLAISQRLTGLMGGRMWVESVEGQGSTFRFTVSYGPAELPVAPAAEAAADEELFEPGLAERHPLRILLAEDNEVNQQLALLILERLGYGADVAGNGLEALDALRQRPYDLVLMDVQMPGMDGLEATRRIVAGPPEEPRPRVVAMTANAMAEDREECRAAGMDAFVSKPIDVKELLAVLKETRPLPPPPVPEPAAPEDDGTLDPAAFARLKASLGRKADALLPGLVARFLEDAVKLQEGARASLAAGDFPALRRAAHTLKSNAASFGALPLSRLCAALEAEAKGGAVTEGERALDAIASAFARVKAGLRATAEAGPPGAVR